MNQKLGKGYKLCSKKTMELIYQEQNLVKNYPFVIRYAFTELSTDKPFQLVFSVPKKVLKKAHDRNRVKRLMRELIRKKKLILEEFLIREEKTMAFFLIYTLPEVMDYAVMEQKIDKLLNKLMQNLNNKSL